MSYMLSEQYQCTKVWCNFKQKSTVVPKLCDVSLIAGIQKYWSFVVGIPPFICNSRDHYWILNSKYYKQIKRIRNCLSQTKVKQYSKYWHCLILFNKNSSLEFIHVRCSSPSQNISFWQWQSDTLPIPKSTMSEHWKIIHYIQNGPQKSKPLLNYQ